MVLLGSDRVQTLRVKRQGSLSGPCNDLFSPKTNDYVTFWIDD